MALSFGCMYNQLESLKEMMEGPSQTLVSEYPGVKGSRH